MLPRMRRRPWTWASWCESCSIVDGWEEVSVGLCDWWEEGEKEKRARGRTGGMWRRANAHHGLESLVETI